MTKFRYVPAARDFCLAAGTFLLLALLVHFGVSTERSRLDQNLRMRVSHEALNHLSRLEAELNANVFLANGMVAHIIAHGGVLDDTVISALRTLHQYGRHIRNIGIAPGNRISHIYPQAGNEAALGLYLPDVPSQWPAVAKSMTLRQTVLAGPVTLRQGGTALVSRTPVFMPDGQYWGAVGLALDMDSLFHAVGLADQVGSIRYALRGKDGAGKDGEVFLGQANLFGQDAVIFDIAIPGGVWQLAAAPVQGWNVIDRDLVALEGAGLVIALALALLLQAHLIGRRRIANSEQRLRAVLETTKDAIIVTDEAGLVCEFNPAAERMFGYDAAHMAGCPLDRLMPRAAAPTPDDMGRRLDGCEFPVEVTVGESRLAGQHMTVRAVRDITERKAFERRLLEFATTDALTGALNRRAFLEAANAALAVARRYGRPLALLMVDADHFKGINDTHGHPLGDATLVTLAERARHSLRTTDIFGRIGGEEFAILLPETDHRQAAEAAERLLATVRAAEVHGENGVVIRFTVSIGIATLSASTPDMETLMRAADHALYQAKHQGRDRWCPAVPAAGAEDLIEK